MSMDVGFPVLDITKRVSRIIKETIDFDDFPEEMNGSSPSFPDSEIETAVGSPSCVPETPQKFKAEEVLSEVGRVDLLSPSCMSTENNREWDSNVFPFNKETLVHSYNSVARILDQPNPAQTEIQLSQMASELHQRKIRSSRTKLEMENLRLGPPTTPPSSPKMCKKRRGGLDN
ncbi:unnamed protein product [Linum trigynum]|uniref:Uncharacterized protein n=1 Tax=Linum trigynum TaxID=586398 RepID=A0AAV2GPD9_9ROSI